MLAKAILFLVLIGSSGYEVLKASVIEEVTLSTAPLNGTSGYLVIDFLGGDPIQFNTATISDFTSNWILQSSTPSGGYLGNLVPGPLILNDSQFFNEWSQAVVFGTAASFNVNLTTNFPAGGTPDDFSLYLLNNTGNPYVTTDPNGANSFLNVNIDQQNPAMAVYTSQFATITVQSNVPEPSTWCLLLLGSLAICLCRTECNSPDPGMQNRPRSN